MAEGMQVKPPSLPANYVSIVVLRERWLQRQKKQKEEEEEAKKNVGCGEDGVEGGKSYGYVIGDEINVGEEDDGGFEGFRVIEEVDVGGEFGGVQMKKGGVRYGGDGRRFGGRKERAEVGLRGGNVGGGYKMVEGLKGFGDRRRVGEGEGVGGDRRRFGKGLENVVGGKVLEGYGKMRVNEEVDGGRKGRVKYGGDRRRFGKGLWVGKGDNEVERKGNAVGGKVLEGSKGYGDRMRIDEAGGVGGRFGGLEISGVRKGGLKYGGYRPRFGKGKGENEVEKWNVVDVEVLEGSKDLGERQVNEVAAIGGKFRGLSSNGGRKGKVKFGRDRRWFGKVSGVGKGENVVEKRNVVDVREESEVVKGNVVDVREENVVDGKMLEVSKGYGFRRINEAVDIGRQFGDLTINGGGRKGKFRSGGDRCRFQPRKEKIYVGVRKGNEVEKPIPAAVRKENEVEKPIAVAVRGENEVEKPIPLAVTKEKEVEKPIVVAVRGENEVQKQYLVDVKEENDGKKQIPVAVRDGNEVEKQNLVDVKMSETSKGFVHRRGNEAIKGKSGGLSVNGWRKGNVKYGRDRGRFGSWKNKQEESGMMWVKKCDAGADKQAKVETADVK